MHSFFFKVLFLMVVFSGCTPVQFESLEGVGVTCDPRVKTNVLRAIL